MICHNIKIIFYRIKVGRLHLNKIFNGRSFFKKNNLIIKFEQMTFTIYKNGQNCINVTGVKHRYQLNKIFDFLKMINFKFEYYNINNSFFKIDLRMKQSSLFSLMKKLQNVELNDYSAKCNAELFSAIIMKPLPIKKCLGYPTILLFSSGKVLLIGGKKMKYIKEVGEKLSSILSSK